MKTVVRFSLLTLLLVVASSPCFALRDILVINKKDAEEMGIELRANAAGPDAVRLELEFKPEGKLKEFTHVELKMTKGKQSFVMSAALRDERSASGNLRGAGGIIERIWRERRRARCKARPRRVGAVGL